MKKKNELLFIVLLIVFPIFSFSQEKLNKDSILVDTKYLLDFYESTNPDPYSGFGGMVYFNLEKRKLIGKVTNEDLDRSQFYDLLSSFLEKSGDAHTQLLNPNSKKDDVKTTKLESPLTFKIANDGLFVQKASLKYKHLVGCKFISVEGFDQGNLISKIFREDHPENLFYTYYLLTFYLKSSSYLNKLTNKTNSTFAFKLQKSDNKIITETITFLDPDETKKETFFEEKKFELPGNSDYYGYKILGNTGYLKIGSMYLSREIIESKARQMQNDTIALRKFIDEQYEYAFNKKAVGSNQQLINEFPVLAKICADILVEMKEKSIPNLIIDLRDNTGGNNDIVYPLFQMLYGDKRFAPHDFIYSIRLSQNYLNQFWNGSIKTYNEYWNPVTHFKVGDYDDYDHFSTSNTIEGKREEYLNRLKTENSSAYDYIKDLNGKPLYVPKNILVLVNPLTFSSGFVAAVDLQNLGAKLVGVPSAQSTNANMQIVNFELPFSHLKGWTSSIHLNYFPSLPREQNVIKLDYPINWNDFKKYNFSKDAEIQFAKDILNQLEN